MRRRALPVLVAVLWPAVACGGGDGAPTVTMTDELRFETAELTIEAGETVTWVNESGDFVHSVTAYQEGVPEGAYFASGGATTEAEARSNRSAGNIVDEQRFEMTFERPGRYEYFCIPHERQAMRGVVVVEG